MTKETNNSQNSIWLNKLLPIGMSISIAASSWFLNQAWSKIINLESQVHQIELTQASSSGSKFTNNDWIAAKNILDSTSNRLDLRITRLEDNNIVIKDTLVEIKQILKEIK